MKLNLSRYLLTPAVVGLIAAVAGCETTGPEGGSGPEHTVAYYIEVESSVPDVTIETNNVAAGKTPLTLKIFGDPPGTFHNFGAPNYSLRALPPSTNDFAQEHSFRAGKRNEPGERIPGVIFLDVSKPAGVAIIDSIPDR